MSNKLLDKLGLTSLITKVADTFAKKGDLVDYAKKSDLNNKQDKLTRVEYFPSNDDQTKIISMSALNTYLNQITLVNGIEITQNKESGYLCFGTKTYPVTSSGSITTTPEFIIVFGRLKHIETKSSWESMVQHHANYFSVPGIIGESDETFLVGLSVVQTYDSDIAASPIRIIPVEVETGGKRRVIGFYAIHETSNEVDGYYIGVLEVVRGVTS